VAPSTALIGREWPATVYEVGREKIREYAEALGETNPVYFDREAAVEAGFRDVVAPPTFCIVYSARALMAAFFDPELGILANIGRSVHSGQRFEWAEPVCSGDVITTTVRLGDLYQQGDKTFYVFESESVNQLGEPTVRATVTDMLRGVFDEVAAA
jgi:acyl dehydratase